jgi:hypothetical protein
MHKCKRRLIVHYPRHGEEVHVGWYAGKDRARLCFVPVLVQTSDVTSLVACLVEHEESTATVGEVLSPDLARVQAPTHWALGFKDLPADQARGYHLLVGQTDGADLGNHVATVEFTVVPDGARIPLRVAPSANRDNIPITFPPSNYPNPICPIFAATGAFLQGAHSVTGNMTDGSGNVYWGTPVDPALLPSGTWMLMFNGNVPNNSGYTFNVKDDLGNTGSSANLTVDSAACVPSTGGPPPPNP